MARSKSGFGLPGDCSEMRWPLKMGPIRRPKTSVNNRSNFERRRSYLNLLRKPEISYNYALEGLRKARNNLMLGLGRDSNPGPSE